MNPAVVRELRETRVQRREVAQLHDQAGVAPRLLDQEMAAFPLRSSFGIEGLF
jgi:hypothetical protein